MLRFGTISQVDADKCLVRVNFSDEDFVSGWLPLLVQKSKEDKFFFVPDPGENVACLMDENSEAGVCLGAIYTSETLPDADVKGEGVVGVKFSDGTVVKYDKAAGELTVDTPGNVIVNAAEATITAPTVTVDGNLEVTGDLSVTGDAAIDGSTDVGGDVKANALVPGLEISLLTHTHTAPGGATGPPLP